MIFEFMREHCEEFKIERMAKVLKVSRSGYYKHINKRESSIKKENRQLVENIKEIHEKSKKVYGSPRIHAVLRKQGKKCSRKRVAKIMKQNNIRAKTRKKWKATKKSAIDPSRVAPNLIKQNFVAEEKNTIWVSDITYIKTNEGWLYVSAILDLYSRKIVGLSMGHHMDTSLIIRSLNQAICHRIPESGLILHSDRGCQYTSLEYKKHTIKHGIILSMSAKGNCYDNAAMESFFHTLKTEHVFFQDFKTRKEAVQSIFEYIEVFYNRQRLHSTLNYLSPWEFEQQRFLESKKRESRVKLALPAKEAEFRIHCV